MSDPEYDFRYDRDWQELLAHTATPEGGVPEYFHPLLENLFARPAVRQRMPFVGMNYLGLAPREAEPNRYLPPEEDLPIVGVMSDGYYAVYTVPLSGKFLLASKNLDLIGDFVEWLHANREQLILRGDNTAPAFSDLDGG